MTIRRGRKQTWTPAKGDDPAQLAVLKHMLDGETVGSVRYHALQWAVIGMQGRRHAARTLERLVGKLKGELGDR